MAHGSITHHFGTAANLQAAVADDVIGQLLEDVRRGVRALRAGDIDEAGLVGAAIFGTGAATQPGVGDLQRFDGDVAQSLARFQRCPACTSTLFLCTKVNLRRGRA